MSQHLLASPSPLPHRRHERGSLPARHLRRMKLTLIWGSYLMLVQCLGWGAFYLFRGEWARMGVAAAAAPVAGIVIWLARRGRVTAAGSLLLGVLWVEVTMVCLVLDVPTANVPRSTHHHLLGLAAGAYLLLRGTRAWVRHGVAMVFFATFLVLASSPWSIPSPYALPDEIRGWGTWLSNAMSLVTLFMVLYLMQADVVERTEVEQDLRHAVDRGQFELHHQPQVGPGGEIIGAEALVRWRHPRRGLVSPAEFIPLAERNGLILPLGDWVLRRACHVLKTWAADPLTANLVLSVNVSVRQFLQPDFVASVLAIVQHSRIDPTRLKLELTESMLVNDMDDVIAKMDALKAHGIGFSLDDFGTGYSSLAYLQRLPIDQLKIDQAFVRNILSNGSDAAIARMVVNLGQNLGLTVIAEGVESQGQHAFLSSVGCHAFQGYLFGKAMPMAEFRALLEVVARSAEAGPAQPGGQACKPKGSGPDAKGGRRAGKRRSRLPPMPAT